MDSLPEELLVEISSRVAASSFSAVHNLRQVSNSFRHTCDDRYVLYCLSLDEIPLTPWSGDKTMFSNFFRRFRRSGNPEALYRKGLIVYFEDNQICKGLRLLAKAAGKGNKEANYVYGMILICLGKPEAIKILSSLIQPLISNTTKELVKLREKVRDSLWWRGILVMKELKTGYVPKRCECNGQTKRFLQKNCVWHGYGKDNDMNTSSACEFCLWDYEVEHLFEQV